MPLKVIWETGTIRRYYFHCYKLPRQQIGNSTRIMRLGNMPRRQAILRLLLQAQMKIQKSEIEKSQVKDSTSNKVQVIGVTKTGKASW